MARRLFLNLLIVLFACFCVNSTWAQKPDETWNNDELFKGYIQKVFDEALPLSKQPKKTTNRSAKDNLVGNDLALYNVLKDKIQQVAAGTITNTQFSIPISDLGSIKTSWTASELGVDKFTSENLLGYYNANFTINFSKVNKALLEDFPYDLYWYDKTKGCQFSTGSISWNESKFYVVGPITFNMYVSANYSKTGAAETFDTNTTLPARVETAKTTALNVVTAHAEETLLQKLTSYRNYICNNVDYNHDAVGETPPPYGDPWQLVYVFDGNAETNVVCEGYSKAFKYLCDLSNFTDAECLLATGTMSGGTGSGPHMWNVMHMDDGRNYLVDVTNCDAGSVGYPDKLFMAYNPNGSYDTYYTFTTTSPNITYTYDASTKSSHGEQALTISTSPYSAPTNKVTLNDNGNIATQLSAYLGQTVNVNYKRPNLTPQKPVTVCLPFSCPIGSEGTYYTFTGVSKVGNTMQANMTANVSGTLTANTPYLFVPADNVYAVDYSGSRAIPATITAGSAVSGRWTFQGVYEKKTWTSVSGNDYGFAAYGGVGTDGTTEVKAGDFVRAAVGASVNAMRCYLTYNPSSVRTRGDDDITELPERITVVLHSSDGATAIGEIDLRSGEVTLEDDVWFDLTGRRLNGKPTQKGIYFNKGRKVILK